MSATPALPKIAIVHDWLTNMGGAERVVLAMHEAFPEAPIYTSVYEPSKVPLFDGLDMCSSVPFFNSYVPTLPEIYTTHPNSQGQGAYEQLIAALQ